MKHFSKNENQDQLSWWNQELTIRERSDIKVAFAYLVEAGTVKRGATESTTGNLTTVLDHLLAEKGDYYKGKIDTTHDLTCHKYD